MKVKCIKTSIDKPNSQVFNSEMEDYLNIGSVFWVYGIGFLRDTVYFYIFDENHLFEVPIELFEVIDDTVSAEWKIKVKSNNEVTLWPDLFYEEYFLENFSEWEKKERQLFDDLRKKIEI